MAQGARGAWKPEFIFEGDEEREEESKNLTDDQLLTEASLEDGTTVKVYETDKAYICPDMASDKQKGGTRISKEILKKDFNWVSKYYNINEKGYWEMVLRVSKASSLKRMRRALSIMGRDESDGDKDMSKFFYPAMQAADIFELGIDVALGGMDQRKAHMFMRDMASKWNWDKATCLHTPILSSLKASGVRMDSFDHKISKYDPNGALLLHDTLELVQKKMKKAGHKDATCSVYPRMWHVPLQPKMLLRRTFCFSN